MVFMRRGLCGQSSGSLHALQPSEPHRPLQAEASALEQGPELIMAYGRENAEENSTDFAVAQQLLLLDRWESVVNARNKRQDVTWHWLGVRIH